MIYRINVWFKLPAPKMTLTPAPSPGFPRFLEMLKEVFLFKSLFKGDKNLWLWSWIFHIMLVLIFVGHFRVFSWLPDQMLAAMGMTPDGINNMSGLLGGGAGIFIFVATLILFIRRLVLQRVREVSSFDDHFAVLLILMILLTGDAMRFISHFDLAQTRDYFYGLVTFSANSLPEDVWFRLHYFFGLLLIMYMPFSKILHFGGIFFSEALIHKH